MSDKGNDAKEITQPNLQLISVIRAVLLVMKALKMTVFLRNANEDGVKNRLRIEVYKCGICYILFVVQSLLWC